MLFLKETFIIDIRILRSVSTTLVHKRDRKQTALIVSYGWKRWSKHSIENALSHSGTATTIKGLESHKVQQSLQALTAAIGSLCFNCLHNKSSKFCYVLPARRRKICWDQVTAARKRVTILCWFSLLWNCMAEQLWETILALAHGFRGFDHGLLVGHYIGPQAKPVKIFTFF